MPARHLPITAFLTTLSATVGATTGPPRVKASRLDKPPVLDGKIDPDEWRQASHVTNFIDPYTGTVAADQTEAWIGFDDKAIYVAFHCHDSKPEAIVGREIRPGSEFNGEDTVTFRINPFGTRGWDGRSRFTVNVLNTQNEDISGGRSSKREWRGDWQSATLRVADGWNAEIRIPWQVLNYPTGANRSMDMNLERYQERTKVGSRWANTTPADRPDHSGFWEGVTPPARDQRKRLQFLGYSAPEIDPSGHFTVRSGLDARLAVTPTLSALASLNPDFRNIEQQVAGIEFTRTERFLEEVRPFFTEGGEFFNLSEDFTFGTMFYPTARIPTFDWGAKAYGRITPTLAVGALTTVDTGNATASVAQVQKSFGPKANLSGYVERYDTPGRANDVFGLNGFVRRGSFNVDFQTASEADEGRPADTAGAVSLAYEVPKWFSLFRQEWVPTNFDPPLALIPWTNRVGWYNYTEYFTQYRKGPLRSFNTNLFSTNFRNYDGKVQQVGSDYFVGVTTKNDTRLSFSQTQTHYADGLDSVTGLGVTFNQSNRFRRFGGYFETGNRASKPSHFLALDASRRIFRGMDVGLSYSALRFDGTDTLAIGTLGWELSPTRSITGRYVQRNGKENFYLAFRNGGLNGMELYVVMGDPNADTFQRRVSVKLVWAF